MPKSVSTATITGEANNLGRKALKAHWNVTKMLMQHSKIPTDSVVFDQPIKAGVAYDVSFKQDGMGHEQVIFTEK